MNVRSLKSTQNLSSVIPFLLWSSSYRSCNMFTSVSSWIFVSTLALISAHAAFNEAYSGSHRSSPFAPAAHHPVPLQKQQVFAVDGYSSSLAGTHGNLAPGHGYAYYGPQGSVTFSQKSSAPVQYAPQPGPYSPPYLQPHGYAPAVQADQPGPAYAPALSYAPQPEQYAPAYAPQPDQYQPGYPAYAPAYTPAYTPGAAQSSYLPPYGQAPGLYTAGGSYAPAYLNGYPAQDAHVSHGPQYIQGPGFSPAPAPAIVKKKRSIPSEVEKSA
nr:PREDICTED: extensin-like [Bemisia tabaci]